MSALNQCKKFRSLLTFPPQLTQHIRSFTAASDLGGGHKHAASLGGGYMQTGHRPDFVLKDVPRVLVTGASGQIGSELVPYLRARYGKNNVVASDVKFPTSRALYSAADGPFVYTDVTDFDQLARVVIENRIDWVFHLAALLSAVGEQQPKLAVKVNNAGLENVLELGRMNDLRVYIPSSIAAFGPSTPHEDTPNLTIMRPTTIYGITKIYGELLGEYYNKRYGTDFRSLRYPGIISSKTMPGGGTTDYAVEIYHDAIRTGQYKCFLGEDTLLPMMYMHDCIKATVMLMEADEEQLSERVYNVTGVSFTPKQQAQSITKILPEFECTYLPDFREAIARSWPQTIDDSIARQDWGWKPDFNMDAITQDMLATLQETYGEMNADE